MTIEIVPKDQRTTIYLPRSIVARIRERAGYAPYWVVVGQAMDALEALDRQNSATVESVCDAPKNAE